jgi:hypothetical protein
LYKLNGAGKCVENDILPTQFQLIGKPVHTGVRFPPEFTSVNPAMAYAHEHSLEFLTSKGQALHSNVSTCASFHTCFHALSFMSTLHCHPRISRRPKITTVGPWTTTMTSRFVSP